MPQVINTNIASLNAQRNLNSSQSALQTSLQRLSSGLRINSAKDDAAGLAISTRMTTQVRGLNQAVRNANDGISMAQVADGALGESVNALQRMKELALQSANATNSSTDRSALNTEVQALIAEVDRIATQTEFNGNRILSTNGGFSASFQVGASAGQTISMTVNSSKSSDLGVASNFGTIQGLSDANFANRLAVQFEGAVTGGTSTVNGITMTGSKAANSNNAEAAMNAVNDVSSTSGVKAFMYGNGLVSAASGNSVAASAAVAAGEIVINGVSIGAAAGGASSDAVAAINAKSGETGVTAAIATDGATTGRVVLFNRTGSAISVQVNGASAATNLGIAQGTTTVNAGQNGAIALNQDLNATTVGFNSTATAAALTGDDADSAEALTNTTVTNLNVNTVASSNLVTVAVDFALAKINTTRAQMGAIQNRLEVTIGNLSSTSENISAARSRIMDADFAMETSMLTRNQILQQAGTAMLSQANQLPQGVMSLLR